MCAFDDPPHPAFLHRPVLSGGHDQFNKADHGAHQGKNRAAAACAYDDFLPGHGTIENSMLCLTFVLFSAGIH